MKSFVVKAPAEAVWDFPTDPAGVARCLPGAAVTHQVDERTHAGTITVKVGPVAATYKGTMRFERLDPAARTVEIVATGRDVRGKGGAEMHMSSTLVERAPGETEVAIRSQVEVMGANPDHLLGVGGERRGEFESSADLNGKRLILNAQELIPRAGLDPPTLRLTGEQEPGSFAVVPTEESAPVLTLALATGLLLLAAPSAAYVPAQRVRHQ